MYENLDRLFLCVGQCVMASDSQSQTGIGKEVDVIRSCN